MANARNIFVAGLVAAGLGAMVIGNVSAGRIAPSVQRTFRGKLIVTNAPFSTAGQNKKAAISTIKKANQAELKATKKEGGVSYYAFHWTAFLSKKPRTSSLSLEFYKKDGKKFSSSMSANKGLTGIDPAITILRGHTEISEDDGINTGKTYKIKLVATINGKDRLLAHTVITFK